MGRRIELACLALVMAVSTAGADILPTPDRGPPMGDAGGLSFAMQSVEVEMGPANGPKYKKNLQVVVLTGCVDGQAHCALAKSRPHRQRGRLGRRQELEPRGRHGAADHGRVRRQGGAGDDHARTLFGRREQPGGQGRFRPALTSNRPAGPSLLLRQRFQVARCGAGGRVRTIFLGAVRSPWELSLSSPVGLGTRRHLLT